MAVLHLENRIAEYFKVEYSKTALNMLGKMGKMCSGSMEIRWLNCFR